MKQRTGTEQGGESGLYKQVTKDSQLWCSILDADIP